MATALPRAVPLNVPYHNAVRLYVARFVDLDAFTLYALLRLRIDVFVVEQNCVYGDLDGRDLEPGTHHMWFAPADERASPQAYLRLLSEMDGTFRIGRVCANPAARRNGLSGQ